VAAAVRDLERVGSVTAQSYTREERTLIRGGLVTHVISSALLGPADLDQDGLILYDELKAYLETYARHTGFIDGIRVRQPRRPLHLPAALVDLNRLERRGLQLEPSSGRGAECFWIRAGAGQLVGELCKQAHERRRVYLPAGRYQVQWRTPPGNGWGREGTVEVGQGFTPLWGDRLPSWWVSSLFKGGASASPPGQPGGVATTAIDAPAGPAAPPASIQPEASATAPRPPADSRADHDPDLASGPPATGQADHGPDLASRLPSDSRAGRGPDLASRPPATARRLSDEESSYLASSPFQTPVTWRELPGRRQRALRLSVGMPLRSLSGRETLQDLAVSTTQERPLLGLSGVLDQRVTPLGAGYLSGGLELILAGSGGNRIDQTADALLWTAGCGAGSGSSAPSGARRDG
jgi:hypothetical protein